MAALLRCSAEDLKACPGIGPTKARRLHDTFHQPFRRTIVAGSSSGGAAAAAGGSGGTEAGAAAAVPGGQQLQQQEQQQQDWQGGPALGAAVVPAELQELQVGDGDAEAAVEDGSDGGGGGGLGAFGGSDDDDFL